MRKKIQQLFEEFLFESRYVKKVRSETLRGYSHVFALLTKLLPEVSLETLSSGTITHFFKLLEHRKRIVGKGVVKVGIKHSTVATYSAKLSVFFEWLVARNYISDNPLRAIRHTSPVYENRKYLKRYDIEKILAAIHLHHNGNLLILKRNLLIFHLFLLCGLRKEELLQLQIRDISPERKMLTIRADTSKSKTSREIPIHSSVQLYLADYLQTRRRYATPYLFVSSTQDSRLTTHGLKHLIDNLREASGVSFHVHQLRHTFAVNFLKTSNNIIKLKQLLGHRSIAMTAIYLRCLPVDQFRPDIENLRIDSLI